MLHNWSVTAPLRLKGLVFSEKARAPNLKTPKGKTKNENVHQAGLELVSQYYEEWSILKHDSGYQLFLEDFKFLFPKYENVLYANWERFASKVLLLAKKNVKDVYGLDLLLQLQQNLNKNSRNIITCLLLPSLCQPTIRVSVPSLPQWKVSVSESRSGFILHVQSTQEIKQAIETRAQTFATSGLRAQPFIVVVGENLRNIQQHYVAVDKYVYRVTNFLAALDACFKSFFALHAPYPKECEQIWLLLQRALYGLETCYDNKCLTNVNVLLKQLI